jgi:hypothetical protein
VFYLARRDRTPRTCRPMPRRAVEFCAVGPGAHDLKVVFGSDFGGRQVWPFRTRPVERGQRASASPLPCTGRSVYPVRDLGRRKVLRLRPRWPRNGPALCLGIRDSARPTGSIWASSNVTVWPALLLPAQRLTLGRLALLRCWLVAVASGTTSTELTSLI